MGLFGKLFGGSGGGERFPDIDWWCDNCGAYLNDQDGFDDHKYVWKCTECGFKSSISKDNIFWDDDNDDED